MERRLTGMQRGALEVVAARGRLQAGWGGYEVSTLRSLEARGLVRLDWQRRNVTSITEAGRRALDSGA